MPLKVLASMGLLLTVSNVLPATAGPLRAGYAKAVITPEQPGQFIAGYGANRVAEGVHDDLWVRAMALDDGHTKMVIVASDLIGLFLPDVDDIARSCAGVPRDNIIITCTHVHSGPDTLGLWGPAPTVSGVDPAYMSMVKERASGAIADAVAALAPCRLRFACAVAPEKTGHNSRERDLIDPEISIMQAVTVDGVPICTLVNYACHPEVLTTESKLITSDFVHYLREQMESAGTGDVLFVNGALGGMVTPDVDANSFAEAERVGRALGEAAVVAMGGAAEHEQADISIARATFPLPMANPLLALAAQMGVIKRAPNADGTLTTTLSAGRIGPAQFATMPGEPLPKVGLAAKDLMDGQFRFFFGLADDELGYLLHAEAVGNARYAYEQRMSINPNAVPLLMEQLAALLDAIE